MNSSSCRIVWDETVPVEVRQAFAPFLERWLFVVPRHLQELRIGFERTMIEGVLEAHCQPEYRYARIMIGPQFLTEGSEVRAECVLHEIVHVAVEPMSDVLDDILNATKPEEALALFTKEQVRRAFEGAVCDLTWMILAAEARGREFASPIDLPRRDGALPR